MLISRVSHTNSLCNIELHVLYHTDFGGICCFSAFEMASAPNDYANLSMTEKLQKIVVEGTKDVKFIFESNSDINEDNGPPALKYARCTAGGSTSVGGGNVVEIWAHKKMLAASSPVFNAIFNGPLKESGDVKIADVSEDAFREFLQIFYNDYVSLTMKNLSQVMELIKKYDVEAGWLAVDTVFRAIDDRDILWGLHLAVKYQRDNLITFCRLLVEQDIQSICNMVDIDDSGKPKLRSNPNNRPMSDADLANVFPLIWRSFAKTFGTVKLKLEHSLGLINSIDDIEDVSFTSSSKVLLTHVKYSPIYGYGRLSQLRRRPYNVEVIIDDVERCQKNAWNGGTIKLPIPVLIEPHCKYTIQTNIVPSCPTKLFFEVFKTPFGTVSLDSNIQIECDATQYSVVNEMHFMPCEE